MKYDTVNYTAVGGFVLLMLVALGTALYQITGSGGPADHYHAYYGNVAGVKYGTPIYYEGYRVGEVEDVEPEHDENGVRYRVKLAIQRGWPVPSDSVAAIASSGLLSDVSITIIEGTSRERLEPGAEISGREGSDIFSAFNQLAIEVRGLTENSLKPLAQELNQALGGGVTPIVEDLRSLLIKLNQSADSLNQVLGPDNRRELAQTLKNMNETTASLTETRVQVDKLLAQANGMLEDNRPEVQASARELRASLEAVSARIDTIMVQLDAASRNMQEFSREIRANPGRLLADKPPADPVETRK
jgi:phospholipid/cholesterol/gamma-HCH transport system substrate-binding protein